VRERARGTEALGEEQDPVDAGTLGRLLDPAVRVEEPRLELEHQLADSAETEVPWLDDPGMDRADGHLHDAISLHAGDGSVRVRLARNGTVCVEILPKRMQAARPVVMENETSRIRMPLGINAEQVLHLALVPVRRRNDSSH